MTPQERQAALMQELGLSQDEAAHFLLDSGEIDEGEHMLLLTPEEAEKVYG